MLNKLVENYLSKAKGLPFFYVVSDEHYNATLEEFKQLGLDVIKISDFCKKPDRFPAIDDLIDSFRIADIDCFSNRCVLIGLGEYLALRGEDEALKVIRGLKNTTLGNARVILLLRHVQNQVKCVAEEDLRLQAQRVFFDNGITKMISVVNIKMPSSGLVQEEGISGLLKQLENGATGTVYAKTDLDLSKSLFSVTTIDNSYDAVKQLVNNFPFSADMGSKELWDKFFRDLQKHSNSISSVLGEFEDLETDFAEKAFGRDYKNWLYFLLLKLNMGEIKNPYLKYVLQRQNNFTFLQREVMNAIIEIAHDAPGFEELYVGRKKLLKEIVAIEGDQVILDFIRENEVDSNESIFKLTDVTLYERQEIIKWISQYGMISEIEYLYPALFSYAKKYVFDCGRVSQELTDYFDQYKQQKIANEISSGFKSVVTEKAFCYTSLATRENVLATIEDKEHTVLYWIDAMGVEYLSYIQDLAKERGLALHIDIVRADLPTITSINRHFYDEWQGEKRKESRLDEIKHKAEGGFDYSLCKLPIHLAKELDIIKEAVLKAAVELSQHRCKKFIIASDHGASRLAVIGQYEERYETDTKGEHSGRCCKFFDGCDIANSITENGYIVLTDYGRFKRSRAANVEVHGGATLEEVVIPLVTLSLRSTSSVEIRIINPNNIVIERKVGVRFMIYISEVESPSAIRVVFRDKTYKADMVDTAHYNVLIADIKRSGNYIIDVFEGENLLGQVTLQAKGAVGTSKSSFDDLF